MAKVLTVTLVYRIGVQMSREQHNKIANKAIEIANKRLEQNPKNPQLKAIFDLALKIWVRNSKV